MDWDSVVVGLAKAMRWTIPEVTALTRTQVVAITRELAKSSEASEAEEGGRATLGASKVGTSDEEQNMLASVMKSATKNGRMDLGKLKKSLAKKGK